MGTLTVAQDADPSPEYFPASHCPENDQSYNCSMLRLQQGHAMVKTRHGLLNTGRQA
jgi:hypothetical protein